MPAKRKKNIYKKSKYYQKQRKRKLAIITAVLSIFTILLVFLGIRAVSHKLSAKPENKSEETADTLTDRALFLPMNPRKKIRRKKLPYPRSRFLSPSALWETARLAQMKPLTTAQA